MFLKNDVRLIESTIELSFLVLISNLIEFTNNCNVSSFQAEILDLD